MDYRFLSCSADNLLSEPDSCLANGWIVNYLSFSPVALSHLRPILVFGDPFQAFSSFETDVNHLLQHHPVILVSLPGHHGNEDKKNVSQLSFEDYADIMHCFIEELGLKKVNILSFSMASTLAYAYASKYPKDIEHLMLGNPGISFRPTFKQFLEGCVWLIDQKNQEPFAHCVIQHLFNMAFRQNTGIDEDIIDDYCDHILALSRRELLFFKAAARRLCDEDLTVAPSTCKTLLFTGEYDHFVMPQESLDLYKRFNNATFVLFKNADHMIQMERPQLLHQVIHSFLNGETLAQQNVLYNEDAETKLQERRKYDRISVNYNVEITGNGGRSYSGAMLDITCDGCLVKLNPGQDKIAPQRTPYRIRIRDRNLIVSGLIQPNHEMVRVVFFKENHEQLNALKKFILKLRQQEEDQA